MESDPPIWAVLLVFLLGGTVVIVKMSVIVLPVIGLGIWLVSRVRRRRKKTDY